MANPMLLWFVGYSNITSIVIVTLCFVAMTIFIGFISMNGDHPGRSNIQIGIEQRNMVKLSNPFFLQLERYSGKLEDGLHLRMSSLLPSKVFVIWGAKIQPFHEFILKPGRWLQKTFVFNKVEDYRELDSLHFDQLEFPEAGDHSINLHCPDSVSSATLGSMPRKRYPVTVLVFVLENTLSDVSASSQNERSTHTDEVLTESESDSGRANSIIGLISIVHLEDEKVTQNSHVISQYVKTSGVPLYSLQPLYLSSDSHQSQPNCRQGIFSAKQKSKNTNDSSETRPEKVHSSNSDISGACCGGTSTGSVGEFSDSCGCSHVKSKDSLLRKRDSHSCESEDKTANVCEKCHTNSCINSEENCAPKAGDQQCRDSDENERKLPSQLLGGVPDGANSEDSLAGQTDNQAECVVCQTHQVRCVLLPCRHACVCLGCFKLLFRCPMCRAGIESYFLLRSALNSADFETDDEDDEQNESGEDEMLQNLQHQAVNASFYQVWQRFNTRLNNILGFR